MNSVKLGGLFFLLAGGAYATAAPGAKDPPKKDAPGLIGEWEMVDAKNGVEKVGQGQPIRVYRFNADGTFQIFEDGKEVGKGRKFKFDSASDPPTLDLNSPSAGPSEPVVPGIYRVNSDRLTICIPYPGKNPRPTAFNAQPGSNRILFEFKRTKQKE